MLDCAARRALAESMAIFKFYMKFFSLDDTSAIIKRYLQIEESKYKEAIELASKAFSEDSVQSQEWKPLPHIFGSPEYLQVTHS